jgi:hypothetical protein
MSPFHHDRGGIVNESIQTLIGDIWPIVKVIQDIAVTDSASALGLRTSSMKLGTYVTPAGFAQDIIVCVMQAVAYPGEFIKRIKQSLEKRYIDKF